MGKIIALGAWSFAIVLSSVLFAYIGILIDSSFGTEPSFMLGLLFLAIFLSVGRLYQEAWKKR
jgi:F0F1-type ATP synthase assembly protein I